MILAIGEILFDHFPDYRRVGGAPFNFSYHLKKMGFPVRFVTRVGDDPEGDELKALLEGNGFNEADLQFDQKHRSGRVNVIIDGEGIPTFNIVPDVAFDHLEADKKVMSLIDQGPDLIYFGTLVQRTKQGRRFFQEIFSRAGEKAGFFCDVNLRPRCYSPEVVQESLAKADVVKLNEEELAAITSLFWPDSSRDDPCRQIMEAFGIELLALTKGDRGSEIHDHQGHYGVGPVQGTKVADTVGAGDAYSAILAIGYLQRWHPERILDVASRFSADICGIGGALPQTDRFYDQYSMLMGVDGHGS